MFHLKQQKTHQKNHFQTPDKRQHETVILKKRETNTMNPTIMLVSCLRVSRLQLMKGDPKKDLVISLNWGDRVKNSRRLRRLARTHGQSTREERTTERHWDVQGLHLELPLSTLSVCEKMTQGWENSHQKGAGKTILGGQGWNNSRNLVRHKSSGWVFRNALLMILN